MALLPLDRQKQIDAAIQDMKLQKGLSYPDNSLLDFVQSFGIKVYEIDFSGHPQIKGIVQYRNKDNNPEPVIYINKDLPKEGKTFTLAHELGHYFLHNGQEKLRIDKYDYSQNTQESLEESEANYFAGSLLVPKDRLLDIWSVSKNLDSIAKFFGVSKPVIETRIQWIQKNQM